MKKATKIVTLLLSLVLVLSLCGCGGNPAKDLYGVWGLDYDMGDMLSKEMGSDFADFNSSLKMTLCFEFAEDGSFKMFVDEDSFKKSFDGWLEDFIAYMTDMLYAEYENWGYSKEQADELMMDSEGCTIEQYVRKYLEGSMNVDSAIKEMETSGTYEVKGNKLYMAEGSEKIDIASYDIFTVTGNTLKIEAPEGVEPEELAPGLKYPLSFYKIK